LHVAPALLVREQLGEERGVVKDDAVGDQSAALRPGLLRLQLYPQVPGIFLTILAGVGKENPGCPTEAIPTHVLGSAKG
jgi:hypothetical protein